MKSFLQILIASVLLVCLFAFSIGSTKAFAASNSGTVTANSLNVREKPSTTSKVVGWLKKGTIVQIYSTKKGWGEVWFKNKKAYVSLKYIKLSSSLSFKKDKTKTYVFKTYGDKSVYKYVSSSRFGTPYEWNKWTMEMGETTVFYERESKSELLLSSNPKGSATIQLKYPLYVGQTWKPNPKNQSFKITALNKTVKTPAGTFKNVIEVKQGSIAVYYFAKNIGLIKRIENGKTTEELQKITKR